MLAELEEIYKAALKNANNAELVSEYNHFLGVKKDVDALLEEMRKKYVGIDKSDLENLERQIDMYKKLISEENKESEPQL